ncbi:MAG: N-acetyl sugar amidotransferase [Deltaproteobacteria bacterium]|nr:N-acetyl sugar amidotransferase [Deltaproteobacteria bacterium]
MANIAIASEDNNYRVCRRCIMDTTDPQIRFNADGICNHCLKYEVDIHTKVHKRELADARLKEKIDDIKRAGQGKQYDCILGISGGVDSTYVAYLARKWGLRPLAVHFDNGWNSEIAVTNIEYALKKLDIDLYTYVVEWDEFRDLQLAFLRASIQNAEIPTDHGIAAILFQSAIKFKVRYILTGDNIATEAILPDSWAHSYWDYRLIQSIHKEFGRVPLKTFPRLPFRRMLYYRYIRPIERVCILDYVPYVKNEAIELLKKELGWQSYGGKHCESVFTRFFQSYILPNKFKFDKRRAHLSSLICSEQISRDQALEELKRDPYDSRMMQSDKEYVAKKLGITLREFEQIMALPIRTYRDYPSDHFLLSGGKEILNWVRWARYRLVHR